ncbi:unnamed protein product, partial [Polarella glacialis]
PRTWRPAASRPVEAAGSHAQRQAADADEGDLRFRPAEVTSQTFLEPDRHVLPVRRYRRDSLARYGVAAQPERAQRWCAKVAAQPEMAPAPVETTLSTAGEIEAAQPCEEDKEDEEGSRHQMSCALEGARSRW